MQPKILTDIYGKPHFAHLFIHTKQFTLRPPLSTHRAGQLYCTQDLHLSVHLVTTAVFSITTKETYNAVPLSCTIRRTRRHTTAVKLCQNMLWCSGWFLTVGRPCCLCPHLKTAELSPSKRRNGIIQSTVKILTSVQTSDFY